MATPTHKQAWIRLRGKYSGEWFVHPELRSKLVGQAETDGTNLTEVVSRILCGHVGVALVTSTRSSRRTSPASDQDLLNCRIPYAAYTQLCRRFPMGWQDGARKVLCDHYGLTAAT